MTAVLLREDRISLADLADREGFHRATIDRWCSRGIRGHRLEFFAVGWKKFTSLQAYERFLAAINGEPAVQGGAA